MRKNLILFVSFLWCFQPFISGQILLKIDKFDVQAANLQLNGNCRILNDILRITAAAPAQAGACWYKQQMPLENGFETEFTFRIWDNDQVEKGGDGFAFVIQSDGFRALGGSGDDIAYKNIAKAVILEFDTHIDDDDKTRNQVSLIEYDPARKAYYRKATVHEIPELTDGKEHFARIEYKDGWLTFYLDSYLFPILSSQADIKYQIGAEDAWLGFTSSTGKAYSNHDIISWTVKEFLPPPPIKTEEIEVIPYQSVTVVNRHLTIKVWDHNKIDGDIVSLKADDQWLLSNFTLEKDPVTVDYTLTGFKSNLILYANNLGTIPPNTATLEVDDGTTKQFFKLEADMTKSQALTIRYSGGTE